MSNINIYNRQVPKAYRNNRIYSSLSSNSASSTTAGGSSWLEPYFGLDQRLELNSDFLIRSNNYTGSFSYTGSTYNDISGSTAIILGDLYVDGNITASGDVVAFLSSAFTGSTIIFDTINVEQPLYKNMTGETIGLKYDTSQFGVNGSGEITFTGATGGITGVTWADIESKPTTVTGFGITDVYTKTESDSKYSLTGHSHSFTSITGKPTTLSGYGITDAVTTGTTQTISGAKTFTSTITGSVSGNAGTTTALQTARTINSVSFNGTSNIAVEPYVETDTSTNATRYLTFVDSNSAGYQRLNLDSALNFNPSTNTLGSANFSGALVGNASTATALQTARTIAGKTFDGTQNVTLSNLTPSTGLNGSIYNGSSSTSWTVAYGTTTGTACAGNDSRLHTHTNSSYLDAINQDLSITGSPTFDTVTLNNLQVTEITDGLVQAGNGTNLLLYSNDFTNSNWNKYYITTPTATGDNPYGGENSAYYTSSSGGYLKQTISHTTTGNYTFSIWIKATTSTTVTMKLFSNTQTTGTQTSLSVTTGWNRIEVTFNFTSAHSTKTCELSFVNVRDYYLWGAQLETGTTAGLYVATTTNSINNVSTVNLFADSYVDGNLTALKEVTAFSDRRLKHSIKNTESVLGNVDKLRIVDYKLFQDNKERTGVIAQELLNVFPQFVNQERSDYLSVNYAGLSTVALKAIQEQNEIIKELKRTINELKEEINKFKTN